MWVRLTEENTLRGTIKRYINGAGVLSFANVYGASVLSEGHIKSSPVDGQRD